MRPSSRRKIEAILAAARCEFFTHGLGEATIEAIARRANVSKVTIYNQFGGKDALFSQVIQSEFQRMRAKISAKSSDQASLRGKICTLGEVMLAIITNPDVVNFERVLAAESGRDPKIGARFLASGPHAMRSALVDLLTEAAESGELEIDDPQIAAEQLAAMIRGFLDVELRLGQSPDVSEDIRTKRVASAVDTFLRAYAKLA